MAGTTVSVGVLAVSATIAAGLALAGFASATSVRAAGAADAAALAAADTASGLVSGIACERAADIATEVGATLGDCQVDGLVATVEVSLAFGPLVASARARAGPPPAGP